MWCPLMEVIQQYGANSQAHRGQIPLCPATAMAHIRDVEATASVDGMVNLCGCAIQMNTGGNIAFISLASSHQSWQINRFFSSAQFSLK